MPRAPTVCLEADEVFGFMDSLGAVREQRDRLRKAALRVLEAAADGKGLAEALKDLRRVTSERPA
jgi:hypothetical protein